MSLDTVKLNTDEQIIAMYEAARGLILYQPWHYFDEDQILVLSTDKSENPSSVAFCHTTGKQEAYYSFSIYRGINGYRSCLNFYESISSQAVDTQYMNTLIQRECLSVSFEPYDKLTEWEKEVYLFVRYLPNRESYLCPRLRYQQSGCYASLEMTYELGEFFIESLVCVCKVLEDKTKRLNVSNITDKQYTLFYELGLGVGEKLVEASTFTSEKKKEKVIFYNDLLVHRLKRLPKIPMTIQVVQFYLPNPIIFDETKTEAIYARVYGFVESEEGQVLCLYIQEDVTFNPMSVLDEVAKECLSYEVRPDFFVTSDPAVYDIIEHFCNRIEVGVMLVDETDVAEDFAAEIYEDILGNSEQVVFENSHLQAVMPKSHLHLDHHEDVSVNQSVECSQLEEVVIAVIGAIYDELKSNKLISGLSEGAMKYYKQIITIFAVEMYKIGDNNPLLWDPNAVYTVILKRLEVALGIKMWLYAEEVLEHYVLLLDEESLCDNGDALLLAVLNAFEDCRND